MKTIGGQKFKQMLVAGANRLEKDKKIVDEMNVFPVPDGDTGTNMSLTVTSAVKEVLAVQTDSCADIAKALSSGALRGARGNSGVIVSQLFRGMSKALKGFDTIDAFLFAQALSRGVATAYKAVMKPKEGTILTVAKAAAAKADEISKEADDLALIMENTVLAAEDMLEQTPELLPVLKEAGVVDSGGKGLCLMYRGFLEALLREDDTIDPVIALGQGEASEEPQKEAMFCTELLVLTGSASEAEEGLAKIRKELRGMGQDLETGTVSSQLMIRIHTPHPGEVLEKALALGNLKEIKIENMEVSHRHILKIEEPAKKNEPRKAVGFLAISVGDGLEQIFSELGVDKVLSGGQTMNPSTDDILHGAAQINADHIIVLPNNKNIILAAKQAALMSKDKTIHVLPSKSVPQGITAMISYVPDDSLEDNLARMEESMELVTSGAVTYAVRDTHMGDFAIKEGNILALRNGDICQVGEDLMDTTRLLVDQMITDETGIFTIYYGLDSSKEDAETLSAYILENYPDTEVEIQEGDQPIYYFLLSAE
ncbi:MAG: DAK2 domain-containing protein [Firmicutes bacterium]|nr:DAK2 domain-containing protein [Bacillota bacterium]